MSDPVNHPQHYNSHQSGVEIIDVTDSMPFCVGNAWKYVARAGLKEKAIEDLKKAIWYLRREITRRQRPGHGRLATEDEFNAAAYEKFVKAEPSVDLRAFYEAVWRACGNDEWADDLTKAVEIIKERIAHMQAIEDAAAKSA